MAQQQTTGIQGYRQLSTAEIDLVNQIKSKAQEIDSLVRQLEAMPDIDKRWLAVGKTDLQKGFMGVVRAIAKPTTF